MTNKSRGVLYIATGEKYLKQALLSAKSIQRFTTNLQFAICTDQPTKSDIWTKIIPIKKTETHFHQYMIDKVSNFKHSPFDETLYLDSDTYITSDITDVFQLLERFDIAFTYGHYRYRRHLIQTGVISIPNPYMLIPLTKNVLKHKIPLPFSPIQGGFFLYNNSIITKKWIKDLENKYIEKQWYDDQVSMRELLWESDIKFYMLPPEYNFAFIDDFKLFQKHQFKSAIPKIFHYSGNRQKDLKRIIKLEKKINNKKKIIEKWSEPKLKDFLLTKIKLVIKTLIGFVKYHFLPRKQFVLILSSVRSGSTLLKALISQAPEIIHTNEKVFSVILPKYASYFHFSRITKGKIILLKQPSHFPTFKTYPILPNLKAKKILLIRNPIDTAISIIKMKTKLKQPITIEQIIEYWTISYKNMKKIIDEDTLIVRYEDIIRVPEQITKDIFQFIGSNKKKGIQTYNYPESGEWKWGIDDGSLIIKKLKVVNIPKSYAPYKKVITTISASKEIQELVDFFNLEMPKSF